MLPGQQNVAKKGGMPCFSFRQHRTIPALRLKHRSGSCGTASAAPRSPYRHLELCGIAFTRFSRCLRSVWRFRQSVPRFSAALPPKYHTAWPARSGWRCWGPRCRFPQLKETNGSFAFLLHFADKAVVDFDLLGAGVAFVFHGFMDDDLLDQGIQQFGSQF